MGNPLVCDCQMKWFPNWVKQKNLAIGALKCSFPYALQDHLVTSLKNSTFLTCANSIENAECGHKKPDNQIILKSSSQSCPQNCTCSNFVVRCSRSSLRSIPDGIIPSVQELYLDSNAITEIPSYVKKLKKLKKLDLSFNKIRSIPADIFESLQELDTLIISFNHIKCIHKTSFSGLGKLRMLSLYGNEITTIPNGSFNDLKSLSHMYELTLTLKLDLISKFLNIFYPFF